MLLTHVNITTEYITLGQLLKFQSIVSNGSDAKSFLLNNKILVNKTIENRRGKKLYPGDTVSINDKDYLIFASK